MIGLDTNVLARYYIDDEADGEAQSQRSAARRLVESGQPLMVCKSVILELEWVMRGYYGFAQAQVALVMQHLLAMLEPPHWVTRRFEMIEVTAPPRKRGDR